MAHRGFAVSQNIYVFSFYSVGMIVSFLVAGLLVDHLGTKRTFLMAHLVLFAVSMAVVGIGLLPDASAKPLLAVALMVSGGMFAVSSVACTAQLFHLVPPRGRAFYMSLSFVVAGSGLGLSPLLAGGVLDLVPIDRNFTFAAIHLDIFQIMIALAGVGLLAFIALLAGVEDVRIPPQPAVGENS